MGVRFVALFTVSPEALAALGAPAWRAVDELEHAGRAQGDGRHVRIEVHEDIRRLRRLDAGRQHDRRRHGRPGRQERLVRHEAAIREGPEQLVEAREKLSDLRSKMDGNEKLESMLEDIISNQDKQKQLSDALGIEGGQEG